MSQLLVSHIKKIGFNLNTEQVNQFLEFENLLVEWNKHMNLTGITDSEGIYDKHFADSITCLLSNKINDGDKVIDVGTGAGFPGLPIKIMKPSLNMTLLDSLNKRIQFLETVCSEIKLDKMEFIHGRAEDFGQDELYREQFDCVVSRAVADLSVLLEYCSPFLKVGGYFIAQKGVKVYDEISSSKNALEILGLEVDEIMEVKTSDETKNHHLLVIKKVKSTDAKYPRRAGKPIKKPL